MLFSILIANYNNGHFFKDCYESIKSQTYPEIEVIIVDDGSTDDSLIIIRELIKNDNRCKLYLNKKNRGCGYTKNKCARLASGDVLGFLDPDDTLEKQAVSSMISAFKKNVNVSLISSNYYLVDLSLNRIRKGNHAKPIPKKESYLTFGKYSITHFVSFKKSSYLLTVGIDQNLKRAVDQDLYYKMEEVGQTIFLNEFLYNYRINENSISANQNAYKAQYWHLVAIINAYKRRKYKISNVKNIKRSDIKILISKHYLYRLERLKFKSKLKTKLYFILKSIICGGRHRMVFKFKSLILVLIGKI